MSFANKEMCLFNMHGMLPVFCCRVKMLAGRSEEVSVDVNKEDQDRINQFAAKNVELHEKEAEVERKKEHVEELEDAIGALYESEEDTAPMMIGESLMILPRMDTIEKIEEMCEKEGEAIAALQEEIGTIKTRLAELKVILYAKFKNSINLEED